MWTDSRQALVDLRQAHVGDHVEEPDLAVRVEELRREADQGLDLGGLVDRNEETVVHSQTLRCS